MLPESFVFISLIKLGKNPYVLVREWQTWKENGEVDQANLSLLVLTSCRLVPTVTDEHYSHQSQSKCGPKSRLWVISFFFFFIPMWRWRPVSADWRWYNESRRADETSLVEWAERPKVTLTVLAFFAPGRCAPLLDAGSISGNLLQTAHFLSALKRLISPFHQQ